MLVPKHTFHTIYRDEHNTFRVGHKLSLPFRLILAKQTNLEYLINVNHN